ncbi:MAG: hypothetical protein V3W06_05305 [Acidimicrobiia bacterium]
MADENTADLAAAQSPLIPPSTVAAPPAPPAAPPAPPAAPAADGPIHMTNDQLNERVSRGRAAMLKKHGFGSEAELKAQQDELKALREAEVTRKQAEMTELEKTQTELATLKSQQEAQAEAFAQQQFESTVNGHCAKLGIANTEYAQFDVEQAAGKLSEGEELDVEAHLKKRLENPQHKAAFGIVEPAPQQVEQGAQTTPALPNQLLPAQPPAGGPPAAQKNVMDMDPQEFAAYQASVHGVSPGA